MPNSRKVNFKGGRWAPKQQARDAFAEALQRAIATGSATVGFRNGSTDEATGQSTETGYDITVVRIDEVRAPA